MKVIQNAWNRFVKVLLMPDDVMGVKRHIDSSDVGAGVRDPATSRVK